MSISKKKVLENIRYHQYCERHINSLHSIWRGMSLTGRSQISSCDIKERARWYRYKSFPKHSKAQLWFTDFAIGSFIFVFMLILFYTYTTNLLDPEVVTIDSVISDAQVISSSLVLKGTPSDWTNTTVESIGITNNDHTINRTKILAFDSIAYQNTKKTLGTIYDYFIYFENENGTPVGVEGICGIGNNAINASYSTKTAYYFDDTGSTVLRPYATTNLNASLYSDDVDYDSLANLIEDLPHYNVVILEDIQLTAPQLTSYKDDFENFTSTGGKLIIAGETILSNGEQIVGIQFDEKATQTEIDRNSTTFKKHPSIDFNLGDPILFETAYYVTNVSGSTNFETVQRFKDDNETAIATWTFGNGTVLFISDAVANATKQDYQTTIERAIPALAEYECGLINIELVSFDNLVKIDRLLIHNQKPVKLILYVWT